MLVKKGDEIEAILKTIPGAADVSVEQVTGQPVLQIQLNQEQLARYGVPAKVVIGHDRIDRRQAVGRSDRRAAAVSAGGSAAGRQCGTAPRRSGRSWCRRRRASGCRSRDWPTSKWSKGPSTITREWGQRRITVSANVRGRDIGSFVAEARTAAEGQVDAAAGPVLLSNSAGSSSICSGPGRG